jgi:hypothetical protein
MGVIFLPSPVMLTADGSSDWVTTDLDSIATIDGNVNVTGVILRVINTSGVDHYFNAREKDSTDARTAYLTQTGRNASVFIGVKPLTREFQCRADNSAINVYVCGYFTDGWVFSANATDKSTSSGSYQNVDVGNAAAIAAIYETFVNSSSGRNVGSRPPGSSRDYYAGISRHSAGWHAQQTVAGIYEQKLAASDVLIWLHGYAMPDAGITFCAEPHQDIIPSQNTAYETKTITGAAGFSGALVEFVPANACALDVRKCGESTSIYKTSQHIMMFVPVDALGRVEVKAATLTDNHLYVLGLTSVGGASGGISAMGLGGMLIAG